MQSVQKISQNLTSDLQFELSPIEFSKKTLESEEFHVDFYRTKIYTFDFISIGFLRPINS